MSTDIGGEWYVNKLRHVVHLAKDIHLSNKHQEEENVIQGYLKVAHCHWRGKRFQTY